jgi:hypothetical protein
MGQYDKRRLRVLHQGIRTVQMDLKSERGRARLATELASADLLLTSFRPSALAKLGLGWRALHRAHPALSLVEIVGAPGARAEEPGHDLTYLADNRPGHRHRAAAHPAGRHGRRAAGGGGRALTALTQARASGAACTARWRCRTPPPGWRCRAPGA